jgi:gluconate 2-dehydrogenase gamma chain
MTDRFADGGDDAMPAPGDDCSTSGSRRRFFQKLSLIPVTAVLGSCGDRSGPTASAAAQTAYRPGFFTADEWALIVAVCDRLIPSDEVGPGAVELGVPEFLDRHMQTPYASGAIWYMQGPFLEAAPEFGYQGRLPLREILRIGIAEMNAHCRKAFGDKAFVQIGIAEQENVLKGAEAGSLPFQAISSKVFFSYLLGEVRNGYFADPAYGGNKGMGSWKMIGYPGARADYLDWVTVRDQPYPLPPVDQAGKRG